MSDEAKVLNLSDEEFNKEYNQLDTTVDDTTSEPIEEPSNQEILDNEPTVEDTTNPTDEPGSQKENEPELTEEDYKNFYNKVAAPFKANGTDMSVRTADEVVQLMQMGANYTKKMQDLAPYRKTIMMLEKNNLLDENKLSYLVDLQNKNPEAIKKLVQDSQLDVYDLNTDEPVEYNPNPNNLISDEEARLRSTVEDLVSSGGDAIIEEARNWDNQSKTEVYKDPNILKILNDQKQSGVYDKVMSEMKRMQVFGQISPNTPFLQAYKQAGDNLLSQSQPIAVRTGTVAQNQNYVNNAQVKAAAMPRQRPAQRQQQLTPADVLSADSSTFEKMYNQFIKQY